MSFTQIECVCLDELKLRFSTRKSGYNTYRGWTQIEYQKQALQHKPKGQRNIGRPRKR
jgi:hypothetical protein